MSFASLKDKVHKGTSGFFGAVAVQIKVRTNGPKSSRQFLRKIDAATHGNVLTVSPIVSTGSIIAVRKTHFGSQF